MPVENGNPSLILPPLFNDFTGYFSRKKYLKKGGGSRGGFHFAEHFSDLFGRINNFLLLRTLPLFSDGFKTKWVYILTILRYF